MKLFKKLFKGNTLYYPGCLTKFARADFADKYRGILELEGIETIILGDKEFCCGSPVKNAGGKKVFKELAQKNLAVFKEHNISTLISNCPSCTAVFKNDYKEALGEQWDIEVKHISEVIDKSLTKLSKKWKGKKATFHDPCHLGRALGIYDEPREVVKKAGIELVEMKNSREKSFCCGAGGGVKTNNSELANVIGKDRTTQAKETGAELLITNCPMCYMQLAENAPSKMEVLELCELFEL